MDRVDMYIDGTEAGIDPAALLIDSAIWVPIRVFAPMVDAEVKDLDAAGALGVCRGDICVPIRSTKNVDGDLYVPLTAFGEALNIVWSRDGAVLRLFTDDSQGAVPVDRSSAPEFELPDMRTGETISSYDYHGRKVAYFTWASW